MSNLNRVCLMGNLTRDAELKYTAKGKSVSNFAIAVNGFNQNEVSFFEIVLWNSETRQQYLIKGTPVLIDGYLQQERFTDVDGGKHSRVVVIAQNLYLLGKKQNNNETQLSDASSSGEFLF